LKLPSIYRWRIKYCLYFNCLCVRLLSLKAPKSLLFLDKDIMSKIGEMRSTMVSRCVHCRCLPSLPLLVTKHVKPTSYRSLFGLSSTLRTTRFLDPSSRASYLTTFGRWYLTENCTPSSCSIAIYGRRLP
jgi:hypothetical protein